MRVIKSNFTGFICGTFVAPHGNVDSGVMEYADGQPIAFHVPRRGVTLNKLYNALRKAPYQPAVVGTDLRERVELVEKN